MHSTTPAISIRYPHIDLLRGWAAIIMIETHVVNCFLSDYYRHNMVWEIVTFINGLVAPSFLFCAGIGFFIGASRKWDEYRHWGKPLWTQLRRLLFIAGVGYALHLPYFSLQKTLYGSTTAEWHSFLQIDVLQAIAFTLIIVTLSVPLLLRAPKHLTRLATILAVAISIVTPIIWTNRFTWKMPVALANLFGPFYTSPFPLFPWATFVLAGIALVGKGMDVGIGKEFYKKVVRVAVIIICISLLAEILPFEIYVFQDYWHASPWFVWLRIALVMLILAGLWLYETKRGADGTISKKVILFGNESLLVYAFHLSLVYGSVAKIDFMRTYAQSLNLNATLGITIGLTVLMYFSALLWNTIKKRSTPLRNVILYVGVAIFLYVFVTSPF